MNSVFTFMCTIRFTSCLNLPIECWCCHGVTCELYSNYWIRYHFSSFLGIVSSLFVVSVSKSKSLFTFVCTIRFTSCLNQPI